MSRVDFSPVFMVRTPSSQPENGLVSGKQRQAETSGLRLTSDDLADADLDDEVATADGRVKPRNRALAGALGDA